MEWDTHVYGSCVGPRASNVYLNRIHKHGASKNIYEEKKTQRWKNLNFKLESVWTQASYFLVIKIGLNFVLKIR